MGSELFFENKKYIPVREANALTGYSKDYIGQLCRANKIDARRIGKVWYVSEVSILNYKPSPKEVPCVENSKNANASLQSKYSISRLSEIFASRRNKDISDEKNSNFFADSAVKTSSLVSAPTPFKFSSNFRPVSVLVAIVFVFGLISIGGQLKNVSPRTLTSAVVNAVSKTINPVDHSGLVVYENINGWVDRNIYSPISNLFGKKGNTIIYVAQTNTTKNNISTTTKVSAKKTVAVTPVVTKVVNNTNVIERIIEKNTITSGITNEDLETRLEQLNNKIMSKFFSLSTGSGGNVTNIYQQIAHSQRIDQLTNTVINNPTINGGSITNTSISAGSISANSASLGTTTLTNLTVSNTSTSTYAGGIAVSGGCVSVNGVCLGTGNGGYSVIEDEGGALTARTTINFVGGGVVASDSGSVTTVTINGTSFTGAANSIIATDASGALVATGTQLTVGNLISTTTVNSYFSGNLGVGTTSPYAPLSVVGQIVGSYFTATTSATSTFAGGIQTNLLNVISTTATSSFANGINITGGCFAVNGTCFSGSGASPLTFTYPLQESSNIVSLAFGTTTTNTWGALQTFEFSSTTYASFNTASTTNLILGGSTFTSLLGTGLSNVGGILTIDSTTQNNAINSYIAASTTIPKTYTSNTFTNTNTFAFSSTTYGSFNTSSSTFATVGTLTLPNLTSGFLGVGANGSTYSFATSTIRTSQLTNDANFSTFNFTSNAGYNSTSTTIGFTNGLFSTASSTFSGTLNLPSLSNGGLAVYGGVVGSYATTTAGTGLTYSANAFNVNTTQNITNLSNLTSNGVAYTAGSNGTLNTVATSSLSIGSSLSLSGTLGALLGGTNSTISLNTGNANTWTALQTFNYSSSTIYSSFQTASTTNLNLGTGQGFLFTGSNGAVNAIASSSIRLSWFNNDAGFLTSVTYDAWTHPFAGASATTSLLRLDGNASTTALSAGYAFFGTTATSTFTRAGFLGVGTSTPWAQLSINPNGIGATTPAFAIGSSTATAFSILTNGNAGSVFNYGTISTTTIRDNTPFSWTIATSTTATPIFRIDTSTGKKATSTFVGGLSVDSGAFEYDYGSGITSIDNLNLGSLNFDTDAGIVSWIDMPVATTTANIINSYTAQMDGNPLLTLFSLSDGLGGVKNLGVGIGTTTASNLAVLTVASTTQPQLSLSAGAGIAQWTFRNAGGNLYLSTTTVQGLSTSSIPAFSINGTSGTTTLWAFNAIATGTNATSTIEGNLNVKGTLKIGAASVYISETGIYSDTGSAFNLSNNGQNITIGSSALTVSATGFGTTTLSGLNVNGSATSTSNVGFNLTGGCFAVNGTCLGGGSSSSASTTLLADTNFWTGSNTFNALNTFAFSSTTYGSFNTSSSTFATVGTLTLPNLTSGFLGVGANGSTYSFATSTIRTSQLTNDANFSTFPFTVNTGYNSTSTVIGFNGLFSTASSTFGSSLFLPSLTQGALYTGTNGLAQTVATSSLSIGSSLSLTGTLGALLGGTNSTISLNTGNANTWSALQSFNYSSSTAYSSFLNASSTNLFTGFLTFSTTTAGTLKVSSSGLVYSDTTSSSGYSTIADEGSSLTQRSILNFIGSGVTCVDNGGSTRTDCTFTSAGGSGGGSWSTTTSSVSGTLVNYSNNDSDIIAIGSNATTSAEFWFDPNMLISYFSGKMGIGSTTPWGQLSINPNGIGSGVPEFVIGSTTETHFIVDGRGYVGIGTTSPYAHLSVVADDNLVNPAYFEGNVNSYFQLNLKNRSNGSSASSDFVATADIGSETTYYLDLGINNSGYTNPAQSSENALDGFLISSDGGLVLGTASSTNANADIRFVTGGLASSSIRATITETGLFGLGTTSPWALLSASSTSVSPLAVFDQRGTGGLLTLQSGGIDRFVVANNGGLSIFADTSDIVRTKTGTTGANDFSRAGSTLTNVESSHDELSISGGTVSGEGTISATTTVTNVITGSGSQVIIRADGKYVIIHGNSSATASLWNGRTNGTISALGVNIVSTGSVGAGAIALKRANGRYQMIHGGGSAGLTSVFDPMGIAPTVAGAATCGAAAIATGTNAILRPDGNYLVMCGGFNASSMFNPVSGTWTVGPTLSTGTYGAGSLALARDDGTFLIMPGNNTANTFVYSPYNTTTNIGTMTNVTISGAPTIGTSTVAIRRQDGKYLIIPGAANTSYLYDPVRTQTNPEGTFTSLGVGPSATMGEGAQAIWRQDGKYLLLLGGTTVTNVIDPGAGSILPTFTSSGAPTLSATPGFGQTAFMLPDGRYAITLGGGTNVINTYDMGFVRGGDYNANTGGTGSEVATYETECIVNGNINPSSTLNWNANAEGGLYFQVKMGSGGTCSGSYQNVIRSGDLIGAASTTNAVQVKVFFKRDLPVFLDQEWGVRKSYLTRYRRVNKDPSLYDITIDNGNLLHRTQFDFGSIVSTTTSANQSNLASGPVSVNITNNGDRNLGMSLVSSIGMGAGVNATMSGLYNGNFASTSALTTGTASSTLVLKRPDGKFIIIVGTTTASTMVYDQADGTITANATAPAQAIGIGALSFKRPDGKFFIVYGNGGNGTSIYDPIANTFSVGTSTVGNVEIGSMLIPLPTGKVLIVHGNVSQTTSIYDPIQETMIAGPATTAVVGPGAMAIPNADGTYMVAPGSATKTCTAISVTATMQFDPYTMLFTAAGTDGFTTNGPGRGALALQRKDGMWLIAKGAGGVNCFTATTITEVYNPVTKRFLGTGAALATAIGVGAHAIPRPDGSWLIFNGQSGAAGVNTTQIYMTGDGTAASGGTEGFGVSVAGPVGPITASGAVSFQRDDGKFVVIAGAATTTSATTVALYDAGWVSQGYYRSEQIDMTGELDSNTTLVWKTNGVKGISAEVRTAKTQAELGTTSPREITTSGENIGAVSTDNWFSVMFNFKRNVPQETGIFQDVVYSNGTGKLRMPYLPIDMPVMYEFKVTKDKDLLNLQADGISMFRVNSSGDIYASTGATINTSGADLAERYTSQEPLDFGDVVIIDPMNNHAVKKSKYQYQTDMVGVVSTDPGFVSGAYTENSYPIGLIGRVPVKVSTENGMIKVGDYLTTSSVSGHAMKATLSGRVLGKALEAIDPTKLVDCPASDLYVPGRKCTTIMMFVNLIDYGGQSVDNAMSDWKTLKTAKLAQTALDSGLEFASTTSIATSTVLVPSMTSHDTEVLSFLSDLKAERATGMSSMSEILTDKVSAISQIISPEIISRIVKSEVIDGLEVRSEKVSTRALTTDTISGNGMTMSLVDGKLVIRGTKVVSTTISTTTDIVATSTLSSELANALSALELSSTTELLATSTDITASTTNIVASTTEPLASTTPVTVVENEVVVSFDTSGNAYFAGEVVANKVSTGALAVTGVATFSGGLEVTSIGSASTTIAMMSDTEFFGRPYFTSDTGGTAVVKKDAKEVEVVFDREYVEAPILSASMAYSTSTDEAEIDAMFNDDIRFVVTKRDTKGFTIRLNKPSSRDIVFNWIALAIKDSKEFTSRTVVPNDPNNNATTTPSVIGGTGTTTPVTGVTSISTTTPITQTTNEIGTTTQTVDTSIASTTPVVIDPNSTNPNPVPPPTTVEVPPVVETTPTPAVDTTVAPPVETPAEVVVPEPAPTATP